MAEPNLDEVFGTGAAQTAAALTIQKAGLTAGGANSVLDATANNRAEEMLVALLLHSRSNLTAARQLTNPEQSIIITDSAETVITRTINNVATRYRQITLSVVLQRPDTGAVINPGDY